jgi:hypothetical protein
MHAHPWRKDKKCPLLDVFAILNPTTEMAGTTKENNILASQ